MERNLITFSMNTFIKICLLDTGGRITEIQKRLSSAGGYDFYKPLQKAVRAHASGHKEKISSILDAPTNDVERKHNKTAFSSFETKFGTGINLQALVEPRKLEFPTAGIIISVDPLFELSKKDVRRVYCLWPTQAPQLTQKYGAVACHIMREANSDGKMANSSFYLADLVSKRVYSEKQITKNTTLILAADINSIGTLIKEL